MKSAAPANKKTAGPEIYRFSARVMRQAKNAKAGNWEILRLPARVGRLYPSDGIVKVEGTINGHPFRAALEGDSPDGRWVRVNQAMLRGAGVRAGDSAKLVILGPEPAPKLPSDFKSALSASKSAKELWSGLSETGQRDWIRWIELAKQHKTRAGRIARAVGLLSSGKRQPCCVNIYEFMLCRIRES